MKRTMLVLLLSAPLWSAFTGIAAAHDESPERPPAPISAQEREARRDIGVYLMAGGANFGGVLAFGYHLGHGITLFGEYIYADGWSYSDREKYGLGMSYEFRLGETVRPFLEGGFGTDFNESTPWGITEENPFESYATTYTYFAAGLRIYLGRHTYLFGSVTQAYYNVYSDGYYGWLYQDISGSRRRGTAETGAYFGFAITGI